MKRNGRSQWRQLGIELLGEHVSEKQLRNYIEQLKKIGKLKTEGRNKSTIYMLGDSERADKRAELKAN